MAIRSVGVVGCGLMGSGIAQVSAQAGFPTVVREVVATAAREGPRLDQEVPPGRRREGQADRGRHGEDAREPRGHDGARGSRRTATS